MLHVGEPRRRDDCRWQRRFVIVRSVEGWILDFPASSRSFMGACGLPGRGNEVKLVGHSAGHRFCVDKCGAGQWLAC
jgi:hypothetical protein